MTLTYNDLAAGILARFATANIPNLRCLTEEPITVDAPPVVYTQFLSRSVEMNAPVCVNRYEILATLIGHKSGGYNAIEATITGWGELLEATINGSVSGRRLGLTAYTAGIATMTSIESNWLVVGGDYHRILDMRITCVVKYPRSRE